MATLARGVNGLGKLMKALAVLLMLLVAGAALVWWRYLRMEPMVPPALPGVAQSGSLEHGGLRRSWLAYVPAARAEQPALVLVLHASQGTGEQMRELTRYGFDVLAERYGFVAVYPDGYKAHWNDCRAGADYAANTENIDDVGFLRELVQRMAEEQGIDTARVFATGLSNGGQMAYRLGLEAPELVAGIAAMAAGLPVAENLDCTPSGRAVAALVMNGTADPVNPYAGGVVEIFGNASRGRVLSSVDTAAYWAGLAGYSGDGEHRAWPQRSTVDPTRVESIDWSAPGRPPVSLITVIGGGHTVPNPLFDLPRILGPTSHQIDGPEVVWAFFSGAAPGPAR